MNKVVRVDRSGRKGLGFSLLELLLVMAVVGVLGSLLLTTISRRGWRGLLEQLSATDCGLAIVCGGLSRKVGE